MLWSETLIYISHEVYISASEKKKKEKVLPLETRQEIMRSKRERGWRKNKRMKGLFRYKIKEKGATVPTEIIIGRECLPTSPINIL